MDASLAEFVDSSLRSLHRASERHLPSIDALLEGLPEEHRQETLCWLLQAFDVMNFPDALLFDTALLLDRYYAALSADEGPGGAQRKLLAAVSTALKTGCPLDLQLPLRAVMTHLARDQIPFEQMVQAELAMLSTLDFHAGTPTSRDFLEALCARLIAGVVGGLSPAWRSLAEFLLQLSLLDASLHFRHPHGVLAASCIALALWVLRAPQVAFEILLEDFALFAAGDTCDMVASCADIHQLWARNIAGSGEQSVYAQHLCVKFGRVCHYQVGTLMPPPAPPPQIPPTETFTPQAVEHGRGGRRSLARRRVHQAEVRVWDGSRGSYLGEES